MIHHYILALTMPVSEVQIKSYLKDKLNNN